MPTSEIKATWLVDCLDTNGRRIKVGAGSTEGGRVVLLQPPDVVPILNQAQAAQYLARVRTVVTDAATRT